jgi:hypothetical protein
MVLMSFHGLGPAAVASRFGGLPCVPGPGATRKAAPPQAGGLTGEVIRPLSLWERVRVRAGWGHHLSPLTPAE